MALCCERRDNEGCGFPAGTIHYVHRWAHGASLVLTHETAKAVELDPYCVTALLPLRPLVCYGQEAKLEPPQTGGKGHCGGKDVVGSAWICCSCHTARTRAMRQTPSSSSLSKTGGCTLKTWKSTLKVQMALENMVQAVPPLTWHLLQCQGL